MSDVRVAIRLHMSKLDSFRINLKDFKNLTCFSRQHTFKWDIFHSLTGQMVRTPLLLQSPLGGLMSLISYVSFKG